MAETRRSALRLPRDAPKVLRRVVGREDLITEMNAKSAVDENDVLCESAQILRRLAQEKKMSGVWEFLERHGARVGMSEAKLDQAVRDFILEAAWEGQLAAPRYWDETRRYGRLDPHRLNVLKEDAKRVLRHLPPSADGRRLGSLGGEAESLVDELRPRLERVIDAIERAYSLQRRNPELREYLSPIRTAGRKTRETQKNPAPARYVAEALCRQVARTFPRARASGFAARVIAPTLEVIFKRDSVLTAAAINGLWTKL